MMAKIHDLFIVELAEVIKGYGNEPDDKDPFRLSEFYRFYELPNIAVSRENFEKMRPIEPERKKGKWIERNPQNSDKCRLIECDQCGFSHIVGFNVPYEHWIENRNFCERCGADMRGEHED